MPSPKDITDRKPRANQQNAQKPIGPRTPPVSEPRPSESGRDRDDQSVHGPIRTTIQAAQRFRAENPDSDEKYLILSKMDRTSLFRRFRLKRNAPDDSKHYEITKQTHRACSAADQTNGTPRFRRPRSDMNKDVQDIQDGYSFILLILSILVIFSYLPDGQPRKTQEAQEGDRGTPMASRLSSLPSVYIFRSVSHRRHRRTQRRPIVKAFSPKELNLPLSAFIRVHPWFYNVLACAIRRYPRVKTAVAQVLGSRNQFSSSPTVKGCWPRSWSSIMVNSPMRGCSSGSQPVRI